MMRGSIRILWVILWGLQIEPENLVPRFSANLTLLFNEVPFLERFERAAAAAGFKAVEFLFPYEFEAREIKSRLEQNGLQCVLHNLPAGDWAMGERGIACHPERREEFRAGVHRAIEYALELKVPQLNCLAGIRPEGHSDQLLRQTLLENLAFAAAALNQAGLKLLIEPINGFDIPGFYLQHTQQALDLLNELGAPNALLQYDIYHAQRMEGELAATLSRCLPRIGHIQIADNPGRHEPGSGEIHFKFLLNHLDQIGYEGWVGAEYRPATTTEAGLGWLEQWNHC
jgi:hydroxypyruvate isomerase